MPTDPKAFGTAPGFPGYDEHTAPTSRGERIPAPAIPDYRHPLPGVAQTKRAAHGRTLRPETLDLIRHSIVDGITAASLDLGLDDAESAQRIEAQASESGGPFIHGHVQCVGRALCEAGIDADQAMALASIVCVALRRSGRL